MNDDAFRPGAAANAWARHPRLLAARPDLAAASLRGSVMAARFVEGRRRRVGVGVLDLKREPRRDAALDTQLLFGETVLVFEDDEGWAWVQADCDGYVGYVASQALDDVAADASHQVHVARTFLYPAADMKRAVGGALPLAARVTVVEECGAFARLRGGNFVWRTHLRAVDDVPVGDVVAVAEGLLGVPYLWGGRSPQGVDCSGLVQLSFGMAGVAMPRDAAMQEELGRALPGEASSIGLERGDLVFWPGHVGIMADAETLIHASGHHMLVCAEPLQVARRRIRDGKAANEISVIRRRT